MGTQRLRDRYDPRNAELVGHLPTHHFRDVARLLALGICSVSLAVDQRDAQTPTSSACLLW